jgi:hypothetical protein
VSQLVSNCLHCEDTFRATQDANISKHASKVVELPEQSLGPNASTLLHFSHSYVTQLAVVLDKALTRKEQEFSDTVRRHVDVVIDSVGELVQAATDEEDVHKLAALSNKCKAFIAAAELVNQFRTKTLPNTLRFSDSECNRHQRMLVQGKVAVGIVSAAVAISKKACVRVSGPQKLHLEQAAAAAAARQLVLHSHCDVR